MTKAVSKNWHQYRTVTKNLPLRNKYDPLHTGANTICYQVDSGVKTDHPIFENSNFENLYSHDGSFEDIHGHGTSMASLIVSDDLGVAPHATIKVVDLLTGVNDVTEDRAIEALDAILADHLPTKEQTKVVFLPWITEKSDVIDAKVIELIDSNLVVVCSAGQKSVEASHFSPAGVERAVTVAATDHYDRAIDADHPWVNSNNGSNHGDAVNIFAPGCEITVADINGFVTVINTVSTSASAAVVAGVCLNIIASNPALTAQEVVDKLYGTAISDIVYYADESKYNAHHNRLVYQENEHYREVWNVRGRLAEFTSGSGTHVVQLPVADDIDAIGSEDYAHIPEFVKIDSKQLIIETDKNAEPGKYQFILSAKSKDNKFNKSFYIDILDENGELPRGKEFFTEVDDEGNYTTTNYLTFQSANVYIK